MTLQALPILRATRFDRPFIPTCLSNGVIGITPGPDPLRQGEALAGGYVYSHPPILLGFTGLRIRDGQWMKYPASLPEGWESIQVDRLWVRGQPMTLRAVHGKKAVLRQRSKAE